MQLRDHAMSQIRLDQSYGVEVLLDDYPRMLDPHSPDELGEKTS